MHEDDGSSRAERSFRISIDFAWEINRADDSKNRPVVSVRIFSFFRLAKNALEADISVFH